MVLEPDHGQLPQGGCCYFKEHLLFYLEEELLLSQRIFPILIGAASDCHRFVDLWWVVGRVYPGRGTVWILSTCCVPLPLRWVGSYLPNT